MHSEIHNIRKEQVTVSGFKGLNHTDITLPGEWYDMCNICDIYSPLLTPRAERVSIADLPGQVSAVMRKNGLYYYSAADGIYCYAPQGDNPFSGQSEEKNVRIFETADRYRFTEMGESILCMDESSNARHLAIENGTVETLGNGAHYEYRSYAHFSGEDDVRETVAYLNRHNVLYRSMNGDVLKHLTREGNKWYDPAAAELLNICFTYEVETEEGTHYIFGDTGHRYNPAAPPAFADSRYFLGTDNKFYYYNKDSASAYEIVAPNVAIFLRKGLQEEGINYPSLSAGDYMRLSVGYAMNYNHISQDYHIYPTKEQPLFENVLLRVNRVIHCNEQTGAGWYAQGWEYCIVVDYSTALVTALGKADLFANSTSYTELTDYTITDPHADRGRQQIYPRFVKIESPFPELSAPVEHNNRIWGADNRDNTLKASALGNFKNWDDYRGLVSDSYTASVGSDGAFTASCVLYEQIYFLKENAYTCVYGTRPANFTLNTVNDFVGVDTQGAHSLQVINEAAYYMACDGNVYRFDGTHAVCISAALGMQAYAPLCSAHSMKKYYLLVADESGNRKLLVYNTQTGFWFCEDGEDIACIFNLRETPCALIQSEVLNAQAWHSELMAIEQRLPANTAQNGVHWWCESGLLGFEYDEQQYISDLKLRFESEEGAAVSVFAKYGSDTAYTRLATYFSAQKGVYTKKIPLKRCPYMRLKIAGTGFSKIFSVSYKFSKGSER